MDKPIIREELNKLSGVDKYVDPTSMLNLYMRYIIKQPHKVLAILKKD